MWKLMEDIEAAVREKLSIQEGDDVMMPSLAVAATVLGTTWTVKYIAGAILSRRDYNKKLKDKHSKLQSILENWVHQVENQIAESDVKEITSLSFDDLSAALHSGRFSARKVLHAYQYHAAQSNKVSNFICEPVVEAEETAMRLDNLTDSEKQKLPLFGIPISLKENYFLEGYDVTVGLVKRIGIPMVYTSYVVQALVGQGAVPFIRTNVPQTCMAFDSSNIIYGLTTNPHNAERSAGGSTGGEGAAIAHCASILGWGSDIGGSLRIPAAWNGIYSLKPTAGRLSHFGDYSPDYNERAVLITVGPMGRDVNTLVAGMKALATPAAHSIDPFTPPLPFNEQEFKSTTPLRIAYFKHMGEELIVPSASSDRSVQMAVDALRDQGHELIEWDFPDVEWAISVAFASDLFADGGQNMVDILSGENVEVHLRETLLLSYLPGWLKKGLATILPTFGFPRFMCNYLRSVSGPPNILNLWKLEAEIKEYRRKVVEEIKSKGIDAIVGPAMPIPAMKAGTTQEATGVVSYLGLMNLLNFPSGVVPITKVTKEDVAFDMKEFPDKDMWHKAMKKQSIMGSEGLPMAVQCITLPFQEERCLRLMAQLEKSIGYSVRANAPSM